MYGSLLGLLAIGSSPNNFWSSVTRGYGVRMNQDDARIKCGFWKVWMAQMWPVMDKAYVVSSIWHLYGKCLKEIWASFLLVWLSETCAGHSFWDLYGKLLGDVLSALYSRSGLENPRVSWSLCRVPTFGNLDKKCPEKNCERSVCSSGLQRNPRRGRTGLLFMGVYLSILCVTAKHPSPWFDCIFCVGESPFGYSVGSQPGLKSLD